MGTQTKRKTPTETSRHSEVGLPLIHAFSLSFLRSKRLYRPSSFVGLTPSQLPYKQLSIQVLAQLSQEFKFTTPRDIKL